MAEYQHVMGRAKALELHPIPGNFDLAHLCAIHERLFQDVYEWAGRLRTINISKNESIFCSCGMLEYYMGDIYKRLVKDNYLRGLNTAEFVDKFTNFYGDVNALHPFREGNGRATRSFIAQLAKQAGYELDQKIIALDPQRWNQAAALTMYRDMAEMRSIFSKALSPV